MLPVVEDVVVDRVLLGKMLLVARESLGQTVRQMAVAAGLTSSHISKIELGQVQVSAENFLRLSHALGLPPGLLLESCAVVSRELFRSISFDDPAVIELSERIGKRHEDARKNTAGFVGSSALAATHLLKSSAPKNLVVRLGFPLPEQAVAFNKFAAQIESGIDFIDRNMLLVNVASSCYQTLCNLELLNERFITDYLSLCESQNPAVPVPWIPHPSPPFFDDELARVEPAKRDMAALIAATLRDKRGRVARKKELSDKATMIRFGSNVKTRKPELELPSLLERLKQATLASGSKSELAAYLRLVTGDKVPLASISRWLSGEREPGGEVALLMLKWVELQEQKTK